MLQENNRAWESALAEINGLIARREHIVTFHSEPGKCKKTCPMNKVDVIEELPWIEEQLWYLRTSLG